MSIHHGAEVFLGELCGRQVILLVLRDAEWLVHSNVV